MLTVSSCIDWIELLTIVQKNRNSSVSKGYSTVSQSPDQNISLIRIKESVSIHVLKARAVQEKDQIGFANTNVNEHLTRHDQKIPVIIRTCKRTVKYNTKVCWYKKK